MAGRHLENGPGVMLECFKALHVKNGREEKKFFVTGCGGGGGWEGTLKFKSCKAKFVYS